MQLFNSNSNAAKNSWLLLNESIQRQLVAVCNSFTVFSLIVDQNFSGQDYITQKIICRIVNDNNKPVKTWSNKQIINSKFLRLNTSV